MKLEELNQSTIRRVSIGLFLAVFAGAVLARHFGFMKSSSTSMYSSLLTISVTLVGFMVTTTSVLMSTLPKIERLRDDAEAQHQLWDELSANVHLLLGIAAASLIGSLAELSEPWTWLVFAAVVAMAGVAVLRVVRAAHMLFACAKKLAPAAPAPTTTTSTKPDY